MSLRCLVGWHAWRPFEIYPVPMQGNSRALVGNYYPDCRECQRCGLAQKHAPGLHHGPYWKSVRASDGERREFTNEQLRLRELLSR